MHTSTVPTAPTKQSWQYEWQRTSMSTWEYRQFINRDVISHTVTLSKLNQNHLILVGLGARLAIQLMDSSLGNSIDI